MNVKMAWYAFANGNDGRKIAPEVNDDRKQTWFNGACNIDHLTGFEPLRGSRERYTKIQPELLSTGLSKEDVDCVTLVIHGDHGEPACAAREVADTAQHALWVSQTLIISW